MSEKLKYLFTNMGWMTISNFASKILIFLMVPFYTFYLSTEGYGFYDLGYTAVVLLAPLCTGNVGESVMRYSLVNKEQTPVYFTTALIFTMIIGFIVSVVFLSAYLFAGIGIDYISVGYLLEANLFYILFTQFARGIDRVRDMAIGGLINSLLLVCFSWVLVVVFKFGVAGCTIATASSALVAALFVACKCSIWRYTSRPSLKCLKELITYGVPLSVNTLGWWINSSFCRYAVAAMLGVSGAGLLAAAYKIPSIPKAIQQIFIQSWQISSIKDFDPYDSDGFFGKVYNISCCVSCLLTSCIIIFVPLLAAVMFVDDFFEAWVYVPMLMLCLVFDCLGSVLGGIFSAVGDTKPIAYSALVSMALTIACCVVMIPYFGLYGAVISSVVSSVVIWLMRYILARKHISMAIRWDNLFFCLIVLVVQVALALFVPLGYLWFLAQSACCIALLAWSILVTGLFKPILRIR